MKYKVGKGTIYGHGGTTHVVLAKIPGANPNGWYGSLNVGYDYGLQKIIGDARTLGTVPRKGSDASRWEIVKMDLMCKTVELTTGP